MKSSKNCSSSESTAEVINVAFVFDDKFMDLFRVAAYSIAKNTPSNLRIYIVDCGIADKNKGKILQLKEKCTNITGIEIATPERVEILEKFSMPAHFSTAVFYRLAIPEVFPELERVIYADCDVIVDGDIAELWNEDLAGRPFGAVEEEGNFFGPKTRLRKAKALSIPAANRYYNSGVLLIDTKKFVDARIFERVIDCVKNTNAVLECPEQDAMNICLNNDEHMPLSPRYNFCPFTPLGESLSEKVDPLIIHYTSAKPWQMNRNLIKLLRSLGLFRFHLKILLKFWEYADAVAFEKNEKNDIKITLKFLYKRVFQPAEQFIRRVRDSISPFAVKRKLDAQ